MEFVLIQGGQQLRLPVCPPEFTIQSSNMNQTVSVVRAGEINLWGPEKLDGLTIQSFFPKEYSSYCNYTGFPAPWECCKMIDNWRNTGDPLRIVIVNSSLGIDINMECLIESFDKTMKDHTGDVYFSITVKRFKRISMAGTTEPYQAPLDRRPIPPSKEQDYIRDSNTKVITTGSNVTIKKPPQSYITKVGDTLWDIAKEKYGRGASWKTVFNSNRDKLVDAIMVKPGTKLTIED